MVTNCRLISLLPKGNMGPGNHSIERPYIVLMKKTISVLGGKVLSITICFWIYLVFDIRNYTIYYHGMQVRRIGTYKTIRQYLTPAPGHSSKFGVHTLNIHVAGWLVCPDGPVAGRIFCTIWNGGVRRAAIHHLRAIVAILACDHGFESHIHQTNYQAHACFQSIYMIYSSRMKDLNSQPESLPSSHSLALKIMCCLLCCLLTLLTSWIFA